MTNYCDALRVFSAQFPNTVYNSELYPNVYSVVKKMRILVIGLLFAVQPRMHAFCGLTSAHLSGSSRDTVLYPNAYPNQRFKGVYEV